MRRRRAWLGTRLLRSYSRGFLAAAEAVQAAKLHSEMHPEQQATTLSAGGPALARAGRPCTSHRQNYRWMRDGGWPRRYGLELRQTLVRDLRVL